MQDADFSDEFCGFIQRTIPTVEAADLVLTLSAHPQTWWSVTQLAASVRPRVMLTDSEVARYVEIFQKNGRGFRWRAVSDLRIHLGVRMNEFLSGAVTMGFLVAALFFLRFRRRTGARLFLAFGIAFLLLALNQALAQWLGAADERVGYTYLLRVLGFVLILGAIVDKNIGKNLRSDNSNER